MRPIKKSLSKQQIELLMKEQELELVSFMFMLFTIIGIGLVLITVIPIVIYTWAVSVIVIMIGLMGYVTTTMKLRKIRNNRKRYLKLLYIRDGDVTE